MAQLVAQYILSVFDNGEISTTLIPAPQLQSERNKSCIAAPLNTIMDLNESSFDGVFDDADEMWKDADQTELSKITLTDKESPVVDKLDLGGTSSRIKQFILVIYHTGKILDEFRGADLDRAVSQAINKTADSMGVGYTTVTDKMSRQVGISMPELKRLITRYFTQSDQTIKNVMLKNVGKRTKQIDTEAIQVFFSNPNVKILTDKNSI